MKRQPRKINNINKVFLGSQFISLSQVVKMNPQQSPYTILLDAKNVTLEQPSDPTYFNINFKLTILETKSGHNGIKIDNQDQLKQLQKKFIELYNSQISKNQQQKPVIQAQVTPNTTNNAIHQNFPQRIDEKQIQNINQSHNIFANQTPNQFANQIPNQFDSNISGGVNIFKSNQEQPNYIQNNYNNNNSNPLFFQNNFGNQIAPENNPILNYGQPNNNPSLFGDQSNSSNAQRGGGARDTRRNRNKKQRIC